MSDAETVRVELADRSYDIVIGDGVLSRAGTLIADALPGVRPVVITDETVASLHLETLSQALEKAGIAFDTIVLPPGEQTKNFKHLEDLLDCLLTQGIDRSTVLIAMGQAFFTLSLGMGAIMAYGAYVPSSASIGSTVAIIAGLDTLVAVAAGLAIFPIVFANGLEPGQGPGLMFVTIPLAFGQMPLGALFGTLFFVLVSFAAITSAISISEPALAYLVETYNAKRSRVAISLGVISWIIGIGTVLSFNLWADVHIVGERTFPRFQTRKRSAAAPLESFPEPTQRLWSAQLVPKGPRARHPAGVVEVC